jgi:inner-membrane-bound regulator SLS-like protein
MKATEARGREEIDERDRVRRTGAPADHDEPASEHPTKPQPSTDKSAKTPHHARDGRAQPERTPEASQEQPSASEKPRGRRGRIGTRHVVLQPESINIDMLGQRAHTIVMRDDLLAKPPRKIEETPAPDADAESAAAEIQAFLEAAEGEPSPEEAHENIEELRPDAGLIQGAEFWELHHQLCEGFTNRQLTDYIAKERKKQKGSKRPLAAGASRPRLPWMTTNYSIRPVQKLEVTADMNPKARKALQLMMEQWHLDIWERVEGLSMTDVTVKNPAVAIVLGAGGMSTYSFGGLLR